MWERFSYYGMRAFLILYMTAPAAAGGLGFADARRRVDLRHLHRQRLGRGDPRRPRRRSLPRPVPQRAHRRHHHRPRATSRSRSRRCRSSTPASALIVVGTGLLKPNVSTLVGSLYRAGRHAARRRVLDLLHGHQPRRVHRPARRRLSRAARRLASRLRLGRRRHGVRPDAVRARAKAACSRRSTRLGGAAGTTASPCDRHGARAPQRSSGGFTAREWKRIGAIVIFFLVAMLFWGAYEQAGSTLNLFADRYTRLEVVRLLVPVVLVPVGAAGLRDPARAGLRVAVDAPRPARAVGAGEVRARPALHGAVVPRARAGRRDGAERRGRARQPDVAGRVATAISELGELCLSPVGLSAVTKLAPVRIVGLMMGVWFLSNSFGNKLAGWAAGFISTMPLETLFGVVAGVLVGGGAASCSRLIKPIRRLMGDEQSASSNDAMVLEKYKQKRNFTSNARAGRRSRALADRARQEGQAAAGPVLLRAEAPRQPPALRLPARAQRRPALVGGPEGAVARSEDQAARDARRGSSVRVRHVRGRHPRGLRRGHRDAVGPGHVDAGGRRRRRGAEEGRPEVHARRLQAEGLVGARAHGRMGARGAAAATARSWLLIKHRDDWAGDVDIAEFAPRSVKSDGDFEDILAADKPDVWVSNRPAKGGEAGAMLAAIIEKAAALKGRAARHPRTRATAQRSSRRTARRKRHRRQSRRSQDSSRAKQIRAPRKQRRGTASASPEMHHEQKQTSSCSAAARPAPRPSSAPAPSATASRK